MGIKRYVILTVIYLLGIGIYAYSLVGENYTLEIYKFSFELPIAVWMVIPAILLFLVSTFHMMFYSFKDFLHNRALNKDFDSFKSSLGRKILGEDSNVVYKTQNYKFIGAALKALKFDTTTKDVEIDDEELSGLCKVVEAVQNGDIVELKKYRLDKNNPLVIQARINKLETDPKYATKVLKECTDECDELCRAAYLKFLSYASFEEIGKLGFTPTKETFRLMMERYLDEEDKFDIPLDAIQDLLMKFKASREDYLELAYEIKIKLNPDAWMALFEKLYNSQDHIEVADAYLFVLYELQMIDKIRDILDNSDEDEFTQFKTLLFLRDNGKNVHPGMFLRFNKWSK